MTIKKTKLYLSLWASSDGQCLAKTRRIKQDMMQELLTGRNRLPLEKES
ncbi:hypothetical protein L2761_002934 [Vibrio parahaemolyticus]|nr:hypothetical protein [Vibrio parahaemolyticus]